MSIKRLSLDDTQNLIGRYQADLKALDFQADEIKSVLKALKARQAALKKVADKKAAAAAKKKAAAAKKKAAAAAKKKAAAAKKKGATRAKKAAKPAKKKAGRPAAKKKAGRPAAKKKAGRPAKKKAGRPVAAKKKAVKKASAGGGKRGRKMSYSDWDMLVINSLKGQKSPVRTSTLLSKGTSFAKKSKLNSAEKFVRAKVAAALQKLVNKTKEVKKVPAEGRGYSYLMS